MSGFEEIEEVAGALLRRLAPPERRSLLRRMARELRGTQQSRIAAQRGPDGERFAPRRPRRELKPGAYAVRFLYPAGAEPREVSMRSWVRQGPMLTGYDQEAGGIRSFFWDRIVKWLPVEAADQNKGAGKLRRRGGIRQAAMFRRLRGSRFLGAGATDREAWIGFAGRAAEIARVHQEGLADRPAAGGRAVRYARRGLLGLTQAERSRALDLLLEHVTATL